MADLTAKDAIDWAGDLERMQDGVELRETIKNRHLLLNRLLPPTMPDGITAAGGVVTADTPSLEAAGRATLAEMLTYTIYFQVANMEGTTKEKQALADNLEKLCVLGFGEMDLEGAFRSDIHWHQIFSAYACAILHQDDYDPEDDKAWPYRFEIPAYDTVFFPTQTAPCTPSVLAVRQKMLVGEFEKSYSKRAGGHEYAEKVLRLDVGNKKLRVYSDDKAADGEGFGSFGKRLFEEVEVVRLYHGDKIYHAIKGYSGDSQTDNEMVYEDDSPCGDVPAVIIPGVLSPQRDAKYRYGCVFGPLMACAMDINNIRARRRSYSDKMANPVAVAEVAPDVRIAEAIDGRERSANPVSGNFEDMLVMRAKMGMMPFDYPADLDQQEARAWAEWAELKKNFEPVDNPESSAQSTANVWLSQKEARSGQLAPTHHAADRGIEMLMEKVIKAAAKLAKDKHKVFSLRALASVPYGPSKKLERGDTLKFTADDLDFPFRLKVETQRVTNSEKRMRLDDAAHRVRDLGIGSPDEIMEAWYDDVTAQKKKVAIALGANSLIARRLSEMELDKITSKRLELWGGIIDGVNDAVAAQTAASAPAASGLPAQAPMNGNTPPVPATGMGSAMMPTMSAPLVEGSTVGPAATGVGP